MLPSKCGAFRIPYLRPISGDFYFEHLTKAFLRFPELNVLIERRNAFLEVRQICFTQHRLIAENPDAQVNAQQYQAKMFNTAEVYQPSVIQTRICIGARPCSKARMQGHVLAHAICNLGGQIDDALAVTSDGEVKYNDRCDIIDFSHLIISLKLVLQLSDSNSQGRGRRTRSLAIGCDQLPSCPVYRAARNRCSNDIPDERLVAIQEEFRAAEIRLVCQDFCQDAFGTSPKYQFIDSGHERKNANCEVERDQWPISLHEPPLRLSLAPFRKIASVR